ncbi:MAG: ribulose-phosphate 3-epimerase [archaeon]|nr:ribulose-phosphate 3-epimerase [archaeon]
MVKVSSSILSCDFSKLGKEIEKLEKAGTDWIHLDVMDGMFVPNITIGSPVIKAIRKITTLPFDVHLMIEKPERYIDDFVKAGSNYLTVHVEATDDIMATINKIHDYGVNAGISVNPETPVCMLNEYLDKVDLVLVMAVHPGFGGQTFREEELSKISYLKDYKKEHNLKYDISVDGGINSRTGRKCVDAGATVLTAGSYLFNTKNIMSEISLWHSY